MLLLLLALNSTPDVLQIKSVQEAASAARAYGQMVARLPLAEQPHALKEGCRLICSIHTHNEDCIRRCIK